MPRPLEPTVTVEIILEEGRDDAVPADVIRQEVTEWLNAQFCFLPINTRLSGFKSLRHGHLIQMIDVVEYTGPDESATRHELQGLYVNLPIYRFCAATSPSNQRRRLPQLVSRSSHPDGEEENVRFSVSALPDGALCNAWKSLLFDDDIPTRLLQYIVKTVLLASDAASTPGNLQTSRMILLHGPAGSGKTTLCRALAQKATIRLGTLFTSSKLIEIDANALLSKWFSESGKHVTKTFTEIHEMATNPASLVFVLLDEVETIAGNRSDSANGTDCRDGLRATNQLLKALDKLRWQKNIILLCTSNMIEAIDSAFLDRVDVKEHIPSPSVSVRYAMIRCGLLGLQDSGVISRHATRPGEQTFDSANLDIDSMNDLGPEVVEPYGRAIPSFAETFANLFDEPSLLMRQLWNLSQKSGGLSGRDLDRLPVKALTMYTSGKGCSLHEVVLGMEKIMGKDAWSEEVEWFTVET